MRRFLHGGAARPSRACSVNRLPRAAPSAEQALHRTVDRGDLAMIAIAVRVLVLAAARAEIAMIDLRRAGTVALVGAVACGVTAITAPCRWNMPKRTTIH